MARSKTDVRAEISQVEAERRAQAAQYLTKLRALNLELQSSVDGPPAPPSAAVEAGQSPLAAVLSLGAPLLAVQRSPSFAAALLASAADARRPVGVPAPEPEPEPAPKPPAPVPGADLVGSHVLKNRPKRAPEPIAAENQPSETAAGGSSGASLE